MDGDAVSDEWVEKRVADLVVGDEVRDTGVVQFPNSLTGSTGHRYVWFPAGPHRWPSHARVDVRRPDEVTVTNPDCGYWRVWINGYHVAQFVYPLRHHAEEFAERLRNDPKARQQALGQ